MIIWSSKKDQTGVFFFGGGDMICGGWFYLKTWVLLFPATPPIRQGGELLEGRLPNKHDP